MFRNVNYSLKKIEYILKFMFSCEWFSTIFSYYFSLGFCMRIVFWQQVSPRFLCADLFGLYFAISDPNINSGNKKRTELKIMNFQACTNKYALKLAQKKARPIRARLTIWSRNLAA
jgi:hypothetical protein